jgi:sulfur carrier protein
MMVVINGVARPVAEGATVADAVSATGSHPGERGIAAALDGRVVARAEWAVTRLHEGAEIEVVRATAGG